jgi:hypothetical protein
LGTGDASLEADPQECRTIRATATEGVAFGALRLGVAGVVNLNALRQEALTATLATAGKDGATALGLHTGTETELAFAGPLGRLIGAFHIRKSSGVGLKKEAQL